MKDIRMRNKNQIKDKTFFLSKWKSFGRSAPLVLSRLLKKKVNREELEEDRPDDAIDLIQQEAGWAVEQALPFISERKGGQDDSNGQEKNTPYIQRFKRKLWNIFTYTAHEEQVQESFRQKQETRQQRDTSTNQTSNLEKITINNYGKVKSEECSHKKIEEPSPKEKLKGGASAIKTKQYIEHRNTAARSGKPQKRAVVSPNIVPGQKKSSGSVATTLKRAGEAIVKAGESLISALAGIGGGCVLIIALCVMLLLAAVLASPMGILYADQVQEPGTILLNMAIAQINAEYAAELEQLQEGEFSGIEIHGAPPDWREVVAVFASKTAGADDGLDVLLLDSEKVERLRKVFWDMTSLRAEEEEDVMHIYIEAKSADDMRMVYLFSRYQNQALNLLLDELDSISSVMGDLTISQEDAIKLLEELPEDLDLLRKVVIEHALSLVGKVNYFWGGKSLVLGWDPRWGTTMQVTSEGSTTTGTYRPFGLDCSGFVDWAFYNATDGEYVLGHGGGTVMQREYCEEISWNEAQPGDLVFYADDSHVGIVGGWDEKGNLLIIHCSGSHNNVVITNASGFTFVYVPAILGIENMSMLNTVG